MRKSSARVPPIPKCRASSPHKLVCGLPKHHDGAHRAFGAADDSGNRKILEEWSRAGQHGSKQD